jgi:uncharacterized repeat protein (TIGR01451 family)
VVEIPDHDVIDGPVGRYVSARSIAERRGRHFDSDHPEPPDRDTHGTSLRSGPQQERSIPMAHIRHFVLALALAALMPTGTLIHSVSAQAGADLAASISGKKTVKLGSNITYTVTATNVGDETATGVEVRGWVPDWFDFVSRDCLGGTPSGNIFACDYADLAPGATASMMITVTAVAPEPNMFEQGFASATNDMNFANDADRIKVIFTKCGGCSN